MLIPEELDEQSAFLAEIRKRTDPFKPRPEEALSMRVIPPIKSIRAKLDAAKASLAEVSIP